MAAEASAGRADHPWSRLTDRARTQHGDTDLRDLVRPTGSREDWFGSLIDPRVRRDELPGQLPLHDNHLSVNRPRAHRFLRAGARMISMSEAHVRQ